MAKVTFGWGQRLGLGCSCDSLRVYNDVADDPNAQGDKCEPFFFLGSYSYGLTAYVVTLGQTQVCVPQQDKHFRMNICTQCYHTRSIKNDFSLSIQLLCLCVRTNLSMLPNHLLSIQW